MFLRASIVLALILPGCSNAPAKQSQASVTVKLPPPRPHVPRPAFSFGSEPRQGG